MPKQRKSRTALQNRTRSRSSKPTKKQSKKPTREILLPLPDISVSTEIPNVDIEDSNGEMTSVFGLGDVLDPLVGTPKDMRETLDGLALQLQKKLKRNRPLTDDDNMAFTRIHAYVHRYLMTMVYRRFPYIRGQDENDVYQEALIAICRKAIVKFNPNKGMSFLNFAKLCIKRHLITILHASIHRRKDMPLLSAVSLDHSPTGEDDDGTLANVITNDKSCESPCKEMEQREAFDRTLSLLKSRLSEFEIVVLEEFLKDQSYNDISQRLSRRVGRVCDNRATDNALQRIRKKSFDLRKESKEEDLPLLTFMR